MPKTLLAMGAHYDDCVFGIPGIMLKAIRKHYRVVILSLIGDYTNWPPAKGREQEIVRGTKEICQRYGAEMRYLDFKSHQYESSLPSKRAVAEVVADVEPDIAFLLWHSDHHDDHAVASEISKVALRHGDRILERQPFKRPRRMYYYDNGPRHTIGFEPNTFVDVTDEWKSAIDWLGEFMALVRNEPYEPGKRDGAQSMKESIARYRGKTCGVEYAEAVQRIGHFAEEIL
jgi:LmbE family N-acetylglucosaminyl deacetylase